MATASGLVATVNGTRLARVTEVMFSGPWINPMLTFREKSGAGRICRKRTYCSWCPDSGKLDNLNLDSRPVSWHTYQHPHDLVRIVHNTPSLSRQTDLRGSTFCCAPDPGLARVHQYASTQHTCEGHFSALTPHQPSDFTVRHHWKLRTTVLRSRILCKSKVKILPQWLPRMMNPPLLYRTSSGWPPSSLLSRSSFTYGLNVSLIWLCSV